MFVMNHLVKSILCASILAGFAGCSAVPTPTLAPAAVLIKPTDTPGAAPGFTPTAVPTQTRVTTSTPIKQLESILPNPALVVLVDHLPGPDDLVPGPDHSIYFSDISNGTIKRYNSDGSVDCYSSL